MPKKKLSSPKHADTLSLKALRSLAEKAEFAEVRLEKLEAENAELRLENTQLKVENQLIRDDIAPLKRLRHCQPLNHRA